MHSLLDAGLIDEVRMLVCPASRGKGTRIFEDSPRPEAGRGHRVRQRRGTPALRDQRSDRHSGSTTPSVVVSDLAAAIAFFVELGLELEGETTVEGESVDQLIGLDGVRADIAFLKTPDGHGRVEISAFHTPVATSGAPRAPVNVPGIPRLTFVVDSVDDVFDRLRPHGAELVGEVAHFDDFYRYAYVRGPDGIKIIGMPSRELQ